MKILYIYKYAILGGVTTQLVNRISELQHHAECHVLYIRDHGGTRAFNDYPHIKIEDNIKRIAEYIDQHKFDFVIVIDTMEGYSALEKCEHKPIVISEVHTTTSNLDHLKELHKTMPMHAFITPSQYLKDQILNKYNYAGKKECYVVENCLDTNVFHTQYEAEVKETPVIVWIGKLDEHKNWRKFVKVARRIKDEVGKVEFWVIGGYTAPQHEVETFVQWIADEDLMDDIKWLPYVAYEDMPKKYREAALSGGLTISTSKNESFGMTAVEAMACKCPLIMPKVGALPEVLAGGLEQYLYDYEDEDYLVRQVKHIFDNNMDKDVEGGYKKVYNCYSINQIVKKYLNQLDSIRQNLT